jgi:peptidoglycan/xylan/chitin deacetylase (PgdA/CDA1 family)
MAAPVILMYHSISPGDDDPFDITVRPARFEQQLRWLRRTGRSGTSVGQLLAARDRFDARRLVGLSFDDGYADFIEYALPLLQRYGFSATMFVPAGQLGKANDWDPEGPRKPVMTRPQLREIADAGIEIGSHGYRHRSLPDTSAAELAEEIETSRAMLRDIAGQPVGGFCYPYGHLDERAVSAVQAAGYGYGCSVWPTEFAGQHALAREYIRQSDSPRSLWKRGLRHWVKHEYHGPGAAALRAAGRTAARGAGGGPGSGAGGGADTDRNQPTPTSLGTSPGKDGECI